MKKLSFFAVLVIAVFFSSCSISNLAMKQPNNHIEFYKGDFDYSPQVSGEATSIRVLGIDWARLLNWKTGEVSGENTGTLAQNPAINIAYQFVPSKYNGIFNALIPVIGDYGKEQVNQYALYEMMKNNPGYDVVFYPQYETTKFVVPLFYSKTTVKATARLGKIN